MNFQQKVCLSPPVKDFEESKTKISAMKIQKMNFFILSMKTKY